MNGLIVTLTTLPKVEKVKFAIFCANKCKHLNKDERITLAIQTAQDWVDNPNEKNVNKCKKAAHAANAAYHDHAVTWTAAYIANTANAAANAANAAYAANAAAYAAANALKVTDESLFEEWMSEKIYKIMECM